MRLIALIALLWVIASNHLTIPHFFLAAECLTRVRRRFILALMISILLIKWPIFAIHSVGHWMPRSTKPKSLNSNLYTN